MPREPSVFLSDEIVEMDRPRLNVAEGSPNLYLGSAYHVNPRCIGVHMHMASLSIFRERIPREPSVYRRPYVYGVLSIFRERMPRTTKSSK